MGSQKTFGERLRDLRISKGLEVSDIAKSTRILERFIEDIESGHFERLPNLVYVKGFTRSILKALKTNPDSWLNDLDLLLKEKDPSTLQGVEKELPAKPETHLLPSADPQDQTLSRFFPSQKMALSFLVGIGFVLIVTGITIVLRSGDKSQIDAEELTAADTDNEPSRSDLFDNDWAKEQVESLEPKVEALDPESSLVLLEVLPENGANIKIKTDDQEKGSMDLEKGVHKLFFKKNLMIELVPPKNFKLTYKDQTQDLQSIDTAALTFEFNLKEDLQAKDPSPKNLDL